jgi:hypothetical protein
LSLGAGATGQQTLTFNTSQAAQFDTAGKVTGYSDTITSIGCGQIIDKSTMAPIDNAANSKLLCKLSSSASTVSVKLATTDIPVTFVTNPALNTGALRPLASGSSASMYAAAVFGVPVLALLGWFSRKKSPRRTLYRFLSLIVLLLGISYATGCGGSYHSSTPPTSGGIPSGSYLVQVVATGTPKGAADSNKYYAVVPLEVAPIQ